jgi:hypothetical protein
LKHKFRLEEFVLQQNGIPNLTSQVGNTDQRTGQTQASGYIKGANVMNKIAKMPNNGQSGNTSKEYKSEN